MRFVRPLMSLALSCALSAAVLSGALANQALQPRVAAASGAPTVVIDPGHGGPYSNANANGLKEKNVNLAIGLELRRILLSRGYEVVMTRTTDRAVALSDINTWNWSEAAYVWRYRRDGRRGHVGGIPKDDLQARANVANRAGADVFISIHNNGSVNRSARGTEVYASRRDRLGRDLSEYVLRRVVARTGLRDRGTHTADFYVCRWTNMPAVLVEGAYISNPADARLLSSAAFRKRLALGIAEGLDAWYADKPFAASRRPVRTTSASAAAVATSRLRFPTGADTVLLARADRWADVPAAPSLAVKLRAPLLWADSEGLSQRTGTEIERLRPKRVVFVGVDGSMDASLAAQIASSSAIATSAIEFVGAADRTSLAARLAAWVGPSRTGEVFIADERDTVAFRALAPAATARRIPLLLARDGALTAEGALALRGRLGAPSTAVLFGPGVRVPASAARGVRRVVRCDGYLSQRVAWLNARYYPVGADSRLSPLFADTRSGAGYLSAALYAAPSARQVLPVSGQTVAPYTRLWLTNLRPQIVGHEVFDATRSIPPTLEHQLRKIDAE